MVFVLIGADTLKKVRGCVKDGGRIISIVEDPGTHFPEESKVDMHFVFVEPNVRELAHIREWVESGKLKSYISAVFNLDDVVEAHAQMETGHTRGKIVLNI